MQSKSFITLGHRRDHNLLQEKFGKVTFFSPECFNFESRNLLIISITYADRH